MPVDVLKIDRSFVSDVDADAQSASIVEAFLELARGLGMTTLAEGIETAEELAFLRERGCELGQGYLFSRPVPPEEIIAFAFGGVPAAAAVAASGLTLGSRARASRSASRRDRDRRRVDTGPRAHLARACPSPACRVTPSLTTRPLSGPVAASASSTASPRPPSTRWSSTTTSTPGLLERARAASRRRSA